jgi:cytochrome c-type biogenesis protein CcmH/NrfG
MNKNNAPEPQPQSQSTWSSREAYLLALVCLFCGFAIGYFVRGSSATIPQAGGTMTAAPQAQQQQPVGGTTAPTPEAADMVAAPLLTALKADPKNADTLVQLGNIYYDHHVYPQAIDYYKQALELKPDDVNVRTDLGTAYWYSGFADNAVTEYQKVLKIRPDYPPTLMNLGVVRMQGLKDYKGAIAVWERWLATNPQHPERQKVLNLVEQAKALMK